MVTSNTAMRVHELTYTVKDIRQDVILLVESSVFMMSFVANGVCLWKANMEDSFLLFSGRELIYSIQLQARFNPACTIQLFSNSIVPGAINFLHSSLSDARSSHMLVLTLNFLNVSFGQFLYHFCSLHWGHFPCAILPCKTVSLVTLNVWWFYSCRS